jgi:predicted Zn-dependent peptidase
MIVYLLADHELPLVNITAYVNTGSIYESADKIGLSGLAGEVMRSGGTRELTPEQLDAELEFMASGIEAGIGADLGNVSMASLKKNLPRTLELFAQVILQPAFNPDRLTLAKNNALEAIRRQNDDPKGIANRELHRALYAGHPLGRIPTLVTVASVTRDDVVAFHRRFFRPEGMILAVSGDFDRDELLAKLAKVFPPSSAPAEVIPKIPPPEVTFRKQVLFARKEVSQSVVRLGHLGIEKNNPDQYAVRIMDYILGGGFTSRLTQEIRSNRGLAYHAGSHFEIGRRYPGTFTADTETKSASTVKAITLMQEIIAGMTTSQVTDQELDLAKDAMINSFIFGFARADSVVNQQARLEYYSFPEGYLEKFRDNIARVTKEDVQRVARKYLHPDALQIVVVGEDKGFDQPLAALGEVTEVKLEIK